MTEADWLEVRRLWEAGEPMASLRASFPRASADEIRSRRDAEGWQRTRDRATQDIYREFVEQNFESVMTSLTKDAELNARLRGLCEKHIERMENDQDLWIQTGTDKEGDPIYVREDPIKSIRSLGQTLQAISASHSEIAAQALLVAAKRPSDGDYVSASDEEILATLGAH